MIDLAARSGLAPTMLARLEQRDHDGDLREIQRVVESMGHGMKVVIRTGGGLPVAAVGTASLAAIAFCEHRPRRVDRPVRARLTRDRWRQAEGTGSAGTGLTAPPPRR